MAEDCHQSEKIGYAYESASFRFTIPHEFSKKRKFGHFINDLSNSDIDVI